MDTLLPILFFGIFTIVMLLVGKALKKKRAGSAKYQKILEDFQQGVNSMLEADEVVESVCGYNPCAAVTSKRLLVGTKKGIETVQFSEIKSLKGLNAKADDTTNPDWMLVFQIKANKRYTLGNHSDGFKQVVEALYRHRGK